MNRSIASPSLTLSTAALRTKSLASCFAVGAALLVLCGCAATGVVRTGAAAASAKPADCSLDIYAARADVTRPFDSVCIVSSESGRTLFNDRSDEGRLQAVKEQACACGADAVVIRDMSRSATAWGQGYSQARISAEAIAYRKSR